MGENKHKA